MREVEGLWVWGDVGEKTLKLGNSAAAASTLSSPPSPDNLPFHAPPTGLNRQGVFALPHGPAFSLDTHFPPSGRSQVDGLFARLATDQTPTTHLELGPLPPEDPASPSYFGVWRDGALIARGVRFDNGEDGPVLDVVLQFVRVLLEGEPLLAVLHGSAVEWRNKRILFVGVSGSGKSTLAAQLVADGGTYISDDYIPLLHGGSIVPIPLSPSIKEGSWPILSGHYPELLGGKTHLKEDIPLRYLHDVPFSTSRAPADLIVFPKFSPTGAHKSVALSKVETLLYLAKAGMWIEPENVDSFVDVIARTPRLALRHTPDLDATKRHLITALEGDAA